jgi:hypothetical protein
MQQRTIRETLSGSCRIKTLTSNPQGKFCWFDYVMRPDPSVATIAVAIGDSPDEPTVQWFPDVRQGIQNG